MSTHTAMTDLEMLASEVRAKFPEGKSVDVAKYLRDHGNAEAADEWEAMNKEHGGKFKKSSDHVEFRVTREISRLADLAEEWDFDDLADNLRRGFASRSSLLEDVRALSRELRGTEDGTEVHRLVERLGRKVGLRFGSRAKAAFGGTPFPVAQLPRTVKSVLKQLKYSKRQINIETGSSYTVYYPGDDAYRGFAAIVNLDPTHVDLMYGDWGGGGLGARPKAVDSDQSPKPLKDGVVVIRGQVGGRGTYAFITVTPATAEQLMATKRAALKTATINDSDTLDQLVTEDCDPPCHLRQRPCGKLEGGSEADRRSHVLGA